MELTISQKLAAWGSELQPSQLSQQSRDKVRNILVDITGLCIAARKTDYVTAAMGSVDSGGYTVIGHAGRASAGGAAFVNGTAAHGEDFDDTFEGGPVHCGVVLVPAMLAAAERFKLESDAVVLGITAGNELMCRLALALPKGIHKAGFHPTAVLGTFAAAFGIAVACRAESGVIANTLGIAGSMASGIIEYLGDGSWTKRMHPGWAARSGLQSFALASNGFEGPAAVFEGSHGAFKAFAHPVEPQPGRIFDELGKTWVSNTISFKPYPCGTMVQPYIDCARQLRKDCIDTGEIESIKCETAEGIVHRLWEPLDRKRKPPTPYAAKFSIPYGVALGLVRDHAGLDDYTGSAITDPGLLTVAGKVGYKIDPDNPYPSAYTGHVRITFKDGSTVESRQGFMRGGRDAPLSRDEVDEKFHANCHFGGHTGADRIMSVCNRIGNMQGDYKLIGELGRE